MTSDPSPSLSALTQEIETIRERHATVTSGPWRIEHETCNGWDVFAREGGSVCVEAWHGGPEHQRYRERFKAEGEFIAHSWADVQRLIAEVQALTEERARLREALEKYRQTLLDFKAGTVVRSLPARTNGPGKHRRAAERREVETIQKTLNVVLVEFDSALTSSSRLDRTKERT